MGEEWDDSLQSKEQIEANLLHKYEAAMKRERALAYSFSHQVFDSFLVLVSTFYIFNWRRSNKFLNLDSLETEAAV